MAIDNEKGDVDRARSLLALKELMQGAEYKERLALMARASRDKYVALRAAGFTEGEALALVMQSPF